MKNDKGATTVIPEGAPYRQCWFSCGSTVSKPFLPLAQARPTNSFPLLPTTFLSTVPFSFFSNEPENLLPNTTLSSQTSST